MQLPFTVEQFFDVMRAYNTSVWPAQFLLLALALAAMACVFVARPWSGAAVAGILGLLWAWIGLVYHLGFFSAVNPMAYLFATVSIAGAGVFFWQGVFRRRLQFRWHAGARGAIGLAFLGFALLVYPVWSTYSGHGYPALPTFGLPCPTTIFTIGLLLFAAAPLPRSVLVVPVLWTFVGAQAAFLFGVHADLGLVLAAVAGAVLLTQPRCLAPPAGSRP